MHEIGLTDYYFKELLKNNRDYLLILVNGICGLNLKEDELFMADTEERDSITYKTINYDIKLVAKDMRLDIEAQKEIVDQSLNEYGEYSYDINRAIYYASSLHSSSYRHREKGYDSRKSIVVFLYNYDMPGDDYIQDMIIYNRKYKREYKQLQIYRVSLAKIPSSGKMELERALKLLTQINVDNYFSDKSDTIRRAAIMLNDYDKSEKAAMLRDAKIKAELETNTKLNVAKREGLEEGLEEGKATQLAANIKTMYSNGFDEATIAKALSLDSEFVKNVLKN